eukprot:CAMPEP_0202796720 /NCGR_PEP_ID=MMETSP1388-20130828/92677_1 /ASSEMBLY_ACC=CAM_ASM_000864 /TAXON_ID=37098 /ORGANISM="Isochrysis sp, Strain CCMP1244" /LENGTH=63 /DNA_ID=CAMNT_0049466623 /DNA_START=3 /DNA_END=190 /DNA_ORIENTATION=-
MESESGHLCVLGGGVEQAEAAQDAQQLVQAVLRKPAIQQRLHHRLGQRAHFLQHQLRVGAAQR